MRNELDRAPALCFTPGCPGGALRGRMIALVLLGAALAPPWPIRMIVPQAPGSASDAVACLLAAELSQQQFGELIRSESAKWADVVRRSGAKVD